VRGNITALDHVEALAGSRVDGDMRAPRIMLEEGSIFNGNCSMDPSRKATDAQQPQTKPQKTEAKQQ
jgi:cytoskeletal protein CcmA (bactofilin family)